MSCNDCKYFNDFSNTYIENNGKFDCCSYWHIAYHKWEHKGNKPCCKMIILKNQYIQLNLFGRQA